MLVNPDYNFFFCCKDDARSFCFVWRWEDIGPKSFFLLLFTLLIHESRSHKKQKKRRKHMWLNNVTRGYWWSPDEKLFSPFFNLKAGKHTYSTKEEDHFRVIPPLFSFLLFPFCCFYIPLPFPVIFETTKRKLSCWRDALKHPSITWAPTRRSCSCRKPAVHHVDWRKPSSIWRRWLVGWKQHE